MSALEAGAGASNTADTRQAGGGAGGGQCREQRRQRRRDRPAFGAQVEGLASRVDAARGEIPDLSARVAKLESDTQKTNAASADLSALAARVDKIEAALAAPKSETRVPKPSPTTPPRSPSSPKSRKIGSARARPFGPDLAALQHLGVDAATLAPLQAVVNGAPTNAALAASFSAIAPNVLAATAQEAKEAA